MLSLSSDLSVALFVNMTTPLSLLFGGRELQGNITQLSSSSCYTWYCLKMVTAMKIAGKHSYLLAITHSFSASYQERGMCVLTMWLHFNLLLLSKHV